MKKVVITALLLSLLCAGAYADNYPNNSPALMPMPDSNGNVYNKSWSGSTQSNTTTGMWSVDLSPMNCSTTPVVQPQAVAKSTQLSDAAVAVLTTTSTTMAVGYVYIPKTVVVGGLPNQLPTVPITVLVSATCK